MSRNHNRNMAYRTPRRQEATVRGSLQLYRRFAGRYLRPWKYSLIFCTIVVCLNGSAVYLMAFYGRYMVDNILYLQSPAPPPVAEHNHRSRSATAGARSPESAKTLKPSMRQRSSHTVAEQSPAGRTRKLLLLFVFHFGTILGLNLLARIANRKQIEIGQHISLNLRDDLHRQILRLSLSSHRNHTAGKLQYRILTDVGIVQQQLMATTTTLAQALFAIIVGAVILLSSHWPSALIAFISAPLYAWIWKLSRSPLKQLNEEARHTAACLYTFITQKLDGIKAIQAYGREMRETLAFRRIGSCYLRDVVSQQRLSAGIGQGCNLIAALATMAILIGGAQQVLAGTMSLGKMLFVYGAAANFFLPVLTLTQIVVAFTQLLVVLQRLADILDETPAIIQPDDAPLCPRPLQQGITLRNLQFAYPDSAPLLKDVSMQVTAGQWVCLMGASGSGKTTLLHLLARLLPSNTGCIELDGIDLHKLQINSLRRAMALVPQEALIFRGSIRDNITYGFPEAEPAEIIAAAEAAQMHELIMKFPARYENLIGERGVDLSGGQRQRLSLARALITNPDILLLDDCTSALDAETEHRIQETLMAIMRGKTALIVSQRVSMARRCQYIYVLDQGVISEAGTHEQLLQNNGFYCRLHARQTE